jgi:uncharacterized Fe-S cluster protein YjdI
MQEYKNDTLIVRYDPKTCIHARRCTGSLHFNHGAAHKTA